jgi:hypothetical protein
MAEDGALREGYGPGDVAGRDQVRAASSRQLENRFDDFGLTGFGRETNPGRRMHGASICK